jgi:hypothetical protein
MRTFTKHAMPVYTQDQDAYVSQMYEWHMKIVQYHDELKSQHLERAKHFQKHFKERGKTVDIPHDNIAA